MDEAAIEETFLKRVKVVYYTRGNNKLHEFPERTILLLEDDHLQSEWILTHLNALAPVTLIKTESQFRGYIDDVLKGKSPKWPDAYVLDIMLRFGNHGNPMPAEVKSQKLPYTFYDAGVRCFSYLRDAERRGNHPMAPAVFYSVLELNVMEGLFKKMGLNPTADGFKYLEKSISDVQHLVDSVREVLSKK